MASYIESPDVSELLAEYARRDGKNKTAALRDLLRRELGTPKERPAAIRYNDMQMFVENNAAERKPITKSDFDGLYEYLDAG